MAKTIELEQISNGKKVTVPLAHWERWPSLKETFRPVAEKKTTAPVAATPPTGDNEQEN